jgi:hypothetical protein
MDDRMPVAGPHRTTAIHHKDMVRKRPVYSRCVHCCSGVSVKYEHIFLQVRDGTTWY